MNLPSQAVTVTKYKTATETQSILAKPIYPQKQPRQGPKFALQRTQWVWWIVPPTPNRQKSDLRARNAIQRRRHRTAPEGVPACHAFGVPGTDLLSISQTLA